MHRSASTLTLGLQSGVLLAVPIPEEHAAVGQQIEEAIQTAVTEARYRKSMWLVILNVNQWTVDHFFSFFKFSQY